MRLVSVSTVAGRTPQGDVQPPVFQDFSTWGFRSLSGSGILLAFWRKVPPIWSVMIPDRNVSQVCAGNGSPVVFIQLPNSTISLVTVFSPHPHQQDRNSRERQKPPPENPVKPRELGAHVRHVPGEASHHQVGGRENHNRRTSWQFPPLEQILDPNPYPDPDSMNPDPQHFWMAETCGFLVSVDDIDLPHFLSLQ